MTIQRALDLADQLKPNMMTRQVKIGFLTEIDQLIHEELVMTHAHTEEEETVPYYDLDTDEGTELLAPWPYDEMYGYWLMARIDDQNLEYDKYENDRAKFNNAYDMFHDWWRRNHMPLTRNRELRI